VLVDIAHNSENVQHLASKAAVLGKRIQELERLERNARARVRKRTGSAPDKNDLDESLNGPLRVWEEDGRVHVWTPAMKIFTPDEADRAAEDIKRVAWEARKGQ
jgi:polyhydroxyalkanoate synthesis regulator protein